MRIVALEEHFSMPELQGRIDPALVIKRGYPPPDAPSARPEVDAKLKDFGEARLKSLQNESSHVIAVAPLVFIEDRL